MSHTNYRRSADPERVRRIQELRRSNAAQPVRNKRKYSRKTKYAGKWE